MKPPCMAVVKYILPAIRAKLAKELIEKHGFKSKDAAELLGLTQAAVSQYLSSKRGQQGIELLDKSEKAGKLIDELIEKIIKKELDLDEEVDYLCQLCMILREENIIFE